MNDSDLVRNCRGDPAASTALGVGRPGVTRTPNLRFWRPLLCQLSYWPRQSPRSSRSGSHSRPYFLSLRGASLDDLRHHAGADRSSALADRKPQPFLHRDRRNQLHRHLDVVAGHHHLRALRQLDRARHVRRPKIKLRLVTLEERRVTATLLLRQNVHLTLELRVRRDRTRLRQHLTALNLLALRPAQQHPNVVPRLPLVQKLAEH